MFCSRCGTQVEDTACFCYKCGSAIPQNASQPSGYQASPPQPNNYQPNYQPNYQSNNYQPNGYQQNNYQSAAPQPNASYGGPIIRDSINLVYPDGHNEIGNLTITASEILFEKKSKFVRIAFGYRGSSLEKGTDALRLNTFDVAYGQKTRLGLNGNVYQLTMKNGAVYKLCVDHPGTLNLLKDRFG